MKALHRYFAATTLLLFAGCANSPDHRELATSLDAANPTSQIRYQTKFITWSKAKASTPLSLSTAGRAISFLAEQVPALADKARLILVDTARPWPTATSRTSATPWTSSPEQCSLPCVTHMSTKPRSWPQHGRAGHLPSVQTSAGMCRRAGRV